jgi:hypothetical protein
MRIKLYHPLWTHIPAIGVLIYFIIRLISAGPLPSQAPTHFDLNGTPNDWGSPWVVFGLIIGLSLFFIILSSSLDEIWAKNETRKTFNWFAVFDEITVGAMAAVSLTYLDFLKSEETNFTFSWAYLPTLLIVPLIISIILEILRRYKVNPNSFVTHDTSVLQNTLEKKIGENKNFIYWESQNPFYINLLATVIPLGLIVTSMFYWLVNPWIAFPYLIAAIILILFYGGFRTVVNLNEVRIRYGFLGITLLRLKMQDITGADTTIFRPLGDFGGYGIRYNGKMTGYFLQGNRGVILTTLKGRKYLIGSNQSEQLSQIIKTILKTQK